MLLNRSSILPVLTIGARGRIGSWYRWPAWGRAHTRSAQRYRFRSWPPRELERAMMGTALAVTDSTGKKRTLTRSVKVR